MNLIKDSGVSTRIKEEISPGSSPSSLEERPKFRVFHTFPALVALMFAVPTSANVQITQPLISMNQTRMAVGWRSRREEESQEAELYAPCHRQQWEEVGPLSIPIVRYVQAKVVFLGPLSLRPLTDEF